MKRLIFLVLFLSLIFRLCAQNAIVDDLPQDQIIYYCSPCGCTNDGQYFRSSGNCSACNMSLQPILLSSHVSRPTIERPTAAMLLFNGADVMDVSGPISVFEHAGFNVVTFSKSANSVRIGMNLNLTPDFTLDALPDVDVLIFPGGGMAESNPSDSVIVKFIKDRQTKTKVLFSVCSGAFFLGEAGLLDGISSTTFAGLIPRLEEQYPKTLALNNVKYADNGNIITSAGLSSGIDASFQVVSKFYGIGRAQDIANHMEYPWSREDDYARSQLADYYIVGLRELVALFSDSFYYSQGDNNSWEYRYRLAPDTDIQEALKLIRHEIEKRDDWSTTISNQNLLVGIMNHSILGKGLIKLELKYQDSNQSIAILKAQRIEKQTF
ncbi:MAG: DJ-1/PfpI family protein [Reichenbachiella sp.]|uniref:DJ-1/PfpI family protein n=1 Tax=Reichenbachiella sp. TaxID=2184521 RepID=UPI0032675673